MLEEIPQFRGGPALPIQHGGRYIRGLPAVDQVALESPLPHHGLRHVPWCMAFTAMTQSQHQVFPPVPLTGFFVVVDQGIVAAKYQTPNPQREADVETEQPGIRYVLAVPWVD